MLLKTALPEFSEELLRLLLDASEPMLAEQVSGLRMVERCRCGDDFCSSFYTAPKPIGSYGPSHRNVALSPKSGMIVLDLVDERIMQVEVLCRPELQSRLNLLLP
jgi:hypothetical protein